MAILPNLNLPFEFIKNITIAKPVTRLAQNAIEELNRIDVTILRKAINTVKNKNIAALGMVNYLERKVKFNEILTRPSTEWSKETIQDVATAFQMSAKNLAVMDAIVSISILNDTDLEDELKTENITQPTDTELTENRRIIWQHPAPGKPLEAPYVVLVAVEQYDEDEATKVIQSILSQLVVHDGYRIPKAAKAKLTGEIFKLPEEALKFAEKSRRLNAATPEIPKEMGPAGRKKVDTSSLRRSDL